MNAQEVKPGDYIPNPANKKFEGTWKLKNKDIEIIVVLKNKERVLLNTVDMYFDEIRGSVTLNRNNKTVFKNPSAIINGVSDYKTSPYLLSAKFKDGDNYGNAKLTFTFPDKDNLNQIQVTVSPYNYAGTKFKAKEIRIPKTFILTREK